MYCILVFVTGYNIASTSDSVVLLSLLDRNVVVHEVCLKGKLELKTVY